MITRRKYTTMMAETLNKDGGLMTKRMTNIDRHCKDGRKYGGLMIAKLSSNIYKKMTDDRHCKAIRNLRNNTDNTEKMAETLT